MRFLALAFILAVFALGYGAALLRRSHWLISRNLIETYRKKFKEFSREYKDSFDQDDYEWLMRNVLRIQAKVEELVTASPYGDYFRWDTGGSARSLVEILDQMSQAVVHEQRLASASNLLTRCLGIADEEVEKSDRQRRNPMMLFREGIRSILLVPSLIGRWASGRSLVDRLTEADNRHTANWVSTCTALGLLIPVSILLIGWSTIAESIASIIREISVLLSAAAEWIANTISLSSL